MRKSFVFIFVLFAGLHSLTAQDRFGIEFRAGASFATQELGDADLKPGIGLIGIVDYRIMPHVGVYAGWGWNRFSTEESFAGDDIDFEETGYMLGLGFDHPIAQGPLNFFLRAGGIYAHIETENHDGEVIDDTGHGWGWQFEGGLDYGFRNNWHLRPAVKFQSLSRDISIEQVTTAVDLTYISASIGIAKRF